MDAVEAQSALILAQNIDPEVTPELHGGSVFLVFRSIDRALAAWCALKDRGWCATLRDNTVHVVCRICEVLNDDESERLASVAQSQVPYHVGDLFTDCWRKLVALGLLRVSHGSVYLTKSGEAVASDLGAL